MEPLVPAAALIGVVIIVAALVSGAVERRGLPLVAAFLALGAAIGPWGLGLADVGLRSPALRVLATLALTFVLFSDAVTLDIAEVRAWKRLTWTLLGPGTLVPAAINAAAAWWLLGLTPAAAIILGAALASTDPVLLRNVMRARALPATTAIALRLETGMNDVVLLPVVIFGMLALRHATGGPDITAAVVTRDGVDLFLLGPGFGAAVGWIGITLLARVRRRIGVRRDYESLYALGLALTAYAAAAAVGGSGFVAAFAAGFVVASQDVELCDCFLEYGEATAVMLLLLTFVALGTSLIWTGLTVLDARTLLFAAIALTARTAVLLPILRGGRLDARDRRLIALFGPRGLSSLLFTLLPVFVGLPGAESLFTVACLVVLLSVVVHGGGIALFLRARAAQGARVMVPEPARASLPVVEGAAEPGRAAAEAGERAGSSSPGPRPGAPAEETAPPPERIDIAELRALEARGEPVVIVDARADRSYRASDAQARGAIRLDPDDPVRDATEMRLSHHATLVVYCA